MRVIAPVLNAADAVFAMGVKPSAPSAPLPASVGPSFFARLTQAGAVLPTPARLTPPPSAAEAAA